MGVVGLQPFHHKKEWGVHKSGRLTFIRRHWLCTNQGRGRNDAGASGEKHVAATDTHRSESVNQLLVCALGLSPSIETRSAGVSTKLTPQMIKETVGRKLNRVGIQNTAQGTTAVSNRDK